MAKKVKTVRARVIRRKDGNTHIIYWENGEYVGGAIRISYDESWLYLTTDDYEGAAMVNIGTLPEIRRVLSQITREIRALPQRRKKARK